MRRKDAPYLNHSSYPDPGHSRALPALCHNKHTHSPCSAGSATSSSSIIGLLCTLPRALKRPVARKEQHTQTHSASDRGRISHESGQSTETPEAHPFSALTFVCFRCVMQSLPRRCHSLIPLLRRSPHGPRRSRAHWRLSQFGSRIPPFITTRCSRFLR